MQYHHRPSQCLPRPRPSNILPAYDEKQVLLALSELPRYNGKFNDKTGKTTRTSGQARTLRWMRFTEPQRIQNSTPSQIPTGTTVLQCDHSHFLLHSSGFFTDFLTCTVSPQRCYSRITTLITSLFNREAMLPLHLPVFCNDKLSSTVPSFISFKNV